MTKPKDPNSVRQVPVTTDLDGLVQGVARAHHLLPEEVWEGLNRAQGARRVIYLALRFNGFSLSQIGQRMSRDHTTVLYHLQRATDADRAQAEQFAVAHSRRAAA